MYIFRDRSGKALYVGKAKQLRSRVRQYLRGHDERPMVPRMLRQANDVEVLLAASELDALRLEDDLIKRLQPPYNVRLRDDRSYPYIAVNYDDEYPQVTLRRDKDRERSGKGVKFFGPYSSTRRVYELLDVINKVFPFRIAEARKAGTRSLIPDLDFQLGFSGSSRASKGRGQIDKDDYRRAVDEAIRFLGGDTSAVESLLTERMKAAAAGHEFELAAKIRDHLEAVKSLAAHTVKPRSLEDFDVIGVVVADEDERGETKAAVQVLVFRSGRLSERRRFLLERAGVESDAEIVERFCLGYYESAPQIPPLLVVSDQIDVSPALAAVLSEMRGSPVAVRQARRGEKKQMVVMAEKNAALSLKRPDEKLRRQDEKLEVLEDLRGRLGLETLPIRIECYDISNLQTSSPVGAMVVFENGQPKRSHYRRFAIEPLESGPDDFKMMNEVLLRRFARPDSDDPSFAAMPDLIVIDGGKGQLSAALDALDRQGVEVAVISLAKREEEIFVPGRPDPIRLSYRSEALKLLRQIRDETHRFVITYHRSRRSKQTFRSVFDTLPGVGEKRKQALLKAFGSAAALKQASVDEIAAVDGISRAVAEGIVAALRQPSETEASS